MIEIRELTKRYGSNTAVDSLSLSIEKGKIYGFLGPNGAGKSTTMNMITGYLASTGGSVEINGVDILERPEEAKRQIGYLPETPPLYSDMTVTEYLDFVAEIKKFPKEERDRLVDDVMERLKLGSVADRLIKNLSKGFCQRVGVAQAIMGYPPIIILDEPTAGLDPTQIIEFRSLVKELGKDHTVIISSHIMQEISAVCDHVFIISHGKLVASDTPQNLEKMSSSEQYVVLGIKGGKEKVRTALKALDGVTFDFSERVSSDKVEEGVVYLSAKYSKSKDIREELFYICAEKRLPIVMMETKSNSLEDVFVRLVSGEEESAEVGTGAGTETDADAGAESGVSEGAYSPEDAETSKDSETAADPGVETDAEPDAAKKEVTEP